MDAFIFLLQSCNETLKNHTVVSSVCHPESHEHLISLTNHVIRKIQIREKERICKIFHNGWTAFKQHLVAIYLPFLEWEHVITCKKMEKKKFPWVIQSQISLFHSRKLLLTKHDLIIKALWILLITP